MAARMRHRDAVRGYQRGSKVRRRRLASKWWRNDRQARERQALARMRRRALAALVGEYAHEPHPSFEVEARALLAGNRPALLAWEEYAGAVDNLLDLNGGNPYRLLPEEDCWLPVALAYERAEENWRSEMAAARAELLERVSA